MTVPTTCKAAAVVHEGKPLEIVDVQVPDELEPGALLVQTKAATICGTDVHRWERPVAPEPLPAPVIIGHEMVGAITRLRDVTHDSVGRKLAEGDRVIWAHGFCGQCVRCTVDHEPTLCENIRLYMFNPITKYPYLTGGFSEFCYVYPTAGRVKVPDSISDAAASAASCAFRTVIAAFDKLGRIDDRHTVVIQGSGPLGLFATTLASRSPAANVIVIGGPEERLAVARQWGAQQTIDITAVPDPAERHEQIMDATGGRGADVVIEVSGAPSAFNQGMDMLRGGGRYLIVGTTQPNVVEFKPNAIMMKSASLIGLRGASIEHYHRALQFMDRNADRYDWDLMISSHFPLEEINTAMERMQSWQEVKPAIDFAA